MLKDIKYTGLNTVSSGYDATAGQLAVAHNVINERGYIEPMTQPHMLLDYATLEVEGYTCMFKHEMLSGVVNYIFYKPADDESSSSDSSSADEGSLMYWTEGSDNPVAQPITWDAGIASAQLYEITAVGNTLCVLTAVGMDYFVWKNGTYIELGTALPEVNIRFGLELGATDLYYGLWRDSQYTIDPDREDTLNNWIHGAVNEFIDGCKKDGEFVYSFLVRYALKLFDGTLVHHSSPVLICVNDWCAPTIHHRCTWDGEAQKYAHQLLVYMMHGRLLMNIQNAIPSSWRDIVTGVEIYASTSFQKFPDDQKPIEWNGPIEYTSDTYPVWADGFGGFGYGRTGTTGTDAIFNKRGLKDLYIDSYAKKGHYDYNYQIIYRDQRVDIPQCGVFYKIYEYDAAFTDTSSNLEHWLEVDTGDMTNLVTNTAMGDDYDSHDIKTPKGAYTYNQRINIYDMTSIVKMPFEPETYQQYLSPSGTDSYTYRLAVKVVRDDGQEVWLPTSYTTNLNQMAANILYLYIPIANVLEARLYKWATSGGGIFDSWYPMTMIKHATLNGSVWFGDFSSPAIATTPSSPTPTEVSSITRYYYNKIYTSEVGNPFNFPVGGINTVGIGKILALASNVRAISQGQFGEYPLYVFTDSGIWMLEVDDKGLYKAKQPMSLDVIEPGSQVTSVDNAVAYVIKRGLMLVSGSETRCISEALDGIAEPTPNLPQIIGGKTEQFNWNEYKKGAVCAYDNVNQRLHIYNPNYAFDWLHNEKPYHYVYSLKTGLWSTVEDDNLLLSTINGRYINTADGLLDITFEEDNHDALTQTILTRPVNFETDAYKRMRDNIQRGDLDLLRTTAGCNVKVLLQGSDDLHNWHNIGGVSKHYRIVRKSGTLHKWFRWMIVISCTPKMYRLHGLTADVEVTGNNKLR